MKSLFKKAHKSSKSSTPRRRESDSLEVKPVRSADDLLSLEKRQRHVSVIRSLVGPRPHIYEVIRCFAALVQDLPEGDRGLFSQEGGFLDHALERTSRALSLLLPLLVPKEKTFHAVPPQQWVWVYVVLTAALFMGVGKIAVKYDVKLCDREGTVLKDWSPHTGSLTTQGKFYRPGYRKENREALQRDVTPLLARQVLDEATSDADKINQIWGFNYLARYPNALEAWLSFLRGVDDRWMTTPALAVVLQADMDTADNHLKNLRSSMPVSALFGGSTSPGQEATLQDMAAGTAFLNWLRNGLGQNSLTVNQADSCIHLTQAGVLLSPELFNAFVNAQSVHKDPVLVEKQLRGLAELYSVSIGDLGERYSYLQGVSTNERALKSTDGVARIEHLKKRPLLVAGNCCWIFPAGKIPALSSHVALIPITQQKVTRTASLSTTFMPKPRLPG